MKVVVAALHGKEVFEKKVFNFPDEISIHHQMSDIEDFLEETLYEIEDEYGS